MKKKIIIADDDEGIIDATVLILELLGYEVHSTLDGSKVEELLNTVTPDLIMLDIWMSGVDGREICRGLKSNEKTKHFPVLMLSASKDIRQSALDSGADIFLEKPFEMDHLINAIESLI